ncbi:hypothetical protein ACF0H5_014190 [Mactra antiquata]
MDQVGTGLRRGFSRTCAVYGHIEERIFDKGKLLDHYIDRQTSGTKYMLEILLVLPLIFTIHHWTLVASYSNYKIVNTVLLLSSLAAHRYEVFIGTDIKDVRQFLEYIKAGDYDRSRQIVKQVIPAKKEAHKKESLLLHILRATKTYIFSIRAIDKSGNTADTSNVVIFTLAEEK